MIKIDEKKRLVIVKLNGKWKKYSYEDPKAFEIVSDLWVQVGWDTKYVYSFTWFGRPIIQLPDDMIRIQEVIFSIKPDIIIETGVAHGGSSVFFASLLELLKNGKVLSIEKSLRNKNRKLINEHIMKKRIEIIDGCSIDIKIFKEVKKRVKKNSRVLVFLDSNHSRSHVLRELEIFSKIVSLNSFIIVCDGIIKDLVDAPRSESDWKENNPINAIKDFTRTNKGFKVVEPKFLFNEGLIKKRVTYWPSAFIKRVK